MATEAGDLDVDDAGAVVVAAALVAMARGPRNLAEERYRLVDHTSRTVDVRTLRALVGDLRPLRTARVAALALTALDEVVSRSELGQLWGDDAGFQSTLEPVRTALRTAAQRWGTRDDEPARPRPLRGDWTPGTLLGIDLGDGTRGYAQFLQVAFLTCYDRIDPITARPPSSAEILALPVAFTVRVNEFCDRPAGWRTIGQIPDGHPIPPPPTRFRQDIVDPRQCELIVDDDWDRPIPATQQDCVGLERAGVSWYPENVEERLRDHAAGRPNQLAERLKVKM